jgi:hypothetical protein
LNSAAPSPWQIPPLVLFDVERADAAWLRRELMFDWYITVGLRRLPASLRITVTDIT